LAFFAGFPTLLQAHISINPRTTESGGKHQMFFIRAPADTESPVVELGFEVDDQWLQNGGEVNSFQDTPGWKRTVERDSRGKAKRVVWTGGEVEDGSFQLIYFSMNTPKEPGKYHFKAWQRLKDGTEIRFDETPAGNGKHPYPIVEVKEPRTEIQSAGVIGGGSLQYHILVIALLALAIALTALRNSQAGSR
jgi:uncharacterized protein YcnI